MIHRISSKYVVAVFFFIAFLLLLFSESTLSLEHMNRVTDSKEALEKYYVSTLELHHSFLASDHPEKSLTLVEALTSIDPSERGSEVTSTMIFDIVTYYCQKNDPVGAFEISLLLSNINRTPFVQNVEQKINELLKKHGTQEAPDNFSLLLKP